MTAQRTKVVLKMGPAPESFKHQLTLLLPGNNEADMEIEYIYRTKRQYFELSKTQKERSETLRLEFEKLTIKHFSMSPDDWEKLEEWDRIQKVAEYLEKGKKSKNSPTAIDEQMRRDAEAVLDVAKGWDLDDLPFTVDSLIAFEDRYPGSLLQIMQGYSSALFDVRLKN